MKVSDFDYYLPEELIAQTPIKNRSESKLMIVDKYNGQITHEKFFNIIKYLKSNDVLVLNNTKVLPSRLYGIKEETGAKIEVLLLNNEQGDIWKCLVKPQKRFKVGSILSFDDNFKCECLEVLKEGICKIKFIYEGIFLEHLTHCGTMPLPPYIHKSLKENNRYNTVYAKEEGSAAAPTAGLHFTQELLSSIKDKGIKILYVTLNIGLGTFRPVSQETVENHNMHSELYYIDKTTAKLLNTYKEEGRRIICVGTTSLRTLEANYSKYKCFKSTCEKTSIFIYPPYKFTSCDGLITNFHLPKSTLIMLVSAFSSKDIIMNAYKEAINNNYKFFSFGDAMFISNINKISKISYYKDITKQESDIYYNKNNIKILNGSNNILLSAPHAYKHIRNNKIKGNEFNTSFIVKILNKMTGTSIIYIKKSIEYDPNYQNDNLYRDLILKYIKEHNIKYFIDIHGMNDYNEYGIEIG
ncbi:MAG: tRNA preQ1(34) S-adenosylmethionine ribosyltransferase-isomerase QueA, partial [Bacilli bacterium]